MSELYSNLPPKEREFVEKYFGAMFWKAKLPRKTKKKWHKLAQKSYDLRRDKIIIDAIFGAVDE